MRRALICWKWILCVKGNWAREPDQDKALLVDQTLFSGIEV